MKARLKKRNFIEWFVDYEDDLIIVAALVKNHLMVNNVVTTETLFETAGYIPANICEGFSEDSEEEFDPSEVELID